MTKKEIGNYIGMTGGDPKHRVRVHLGTFKDRTKIKKTKLSEEIWRLQDEGTAYTLHWEKLADAQPRKPNMTICNLCCKEALLIMKRDKLSINSRRELGDTCLHRRKHLIFIAVGKKEPPDV